MVRAPVLCLTIVAAFQLQLTAAQTPAVLHSPNEEVAVPAPTLTLARTLGLDPERDRARFLSELTRLVYTPPAGRHPEIDDQLRAAARPQPPARTGRPAVTVPVPLTAELWSRAVFRRPVPADALVAAIAADRKAALLAYGLAALDDETLDYLSREPSAAPGAVRRRRADLRRLRRQPSRARQPRRPRWRRAGRRPVGHGPRPAGR